VALADGTLTIWTTIICGLSLFSWRDRPKSIIRLPTVPLRLASCFNISSHLLIRLCEIICRTVTVSRVANFIRQPRSEVATFTAHGADRICRSEVRGTMAQRSFLTVERIADWLPIAVFASLPIVGLVAGPFSPTPAAQRRGWSNGGELRSLVMWPGRCPTPVL
jgi:hypothetical protein